MTINSPLRGHSVSPSPSTAQPLQIFLFSLVTLLLSSPLLSSPLGNQLIKKTEHESLYCFTAQSLEIKVKKMNYAFRIFSLASKYKILLVDLSVAFTSVVFPWKPSLLIRSIFLKLNMINLTVIYLALKLRDVDIFGLKWGHFTKWWTVGLVIIDLFRLYFCWLQNLVNLNHYRK